MNTYIDGIYNYCDRWCERCDFTSRCRTFALEKKLEEAEKEDGIEKEKFWEILQSVFDEQNQVETGSESDSLYEMESIDSPEEYNSYPELDRNKTDENLLFQTARSYSTEVHQWVEQYELEIRNIPRDTIKMAQIEDALETVLRYAFFIPVKLARAVDGNVEDTFEDLPDDSDANGSAKVAMIAMNKSIGAWSDIRSEFKKDKDMTARFIGILISLRRATEVSFPKAMKFIRPGFDD